ncbi:MAG TPA: SRPBCC family protein [Candidatus Dormibacteraeota bacterium]
MPMATLIRRIGLDLPPESAFRACVRLLTDADPSRGVVDRRCSPHPPREGSEILTRVRDRRGERTLRARIVELDPPRSLATATEDEGPAVRTGLAVEPAGHGSIVTLRSDATTALGVMVRATGLVDRALLARAQRRAVRATLRRLRELAAEF